jgi:NitT/TauT family transport system substrate-binding protein
MRKAIFAAALVSVGVAVTPVSAQTSINVSYQPSVFWGFPFYLAAQKGWWADAGLKVDFSVFPAGAPQVAAAQAKSWDLGGTGSVPAVLGAVRSGLITIGVTNDESKTNVLMASRDHYAAFAANPKSISGQKILLTTNSTGDYAVRACLAHYNVPAKDVEFINLAQAQIISAVSSGNGDLAGVWAPNNYTLGEKASAKTLCTGSDAGAIVPGVLVVRADFAKEQPKVVAAFLATYLRGWGWARSHSKEARDLLKKFYADGGVEISDKAIDQEFAERPTFSLAEQLKLMEPASGGSQLDGWMDKISAFMVQAGTLPRAPDAKSYIDADYMKMVAADPKLKAFATEFDPHP